MRFFRQCDFDSPPKISIVLLDWSVRESFHVLHYLARQVARRSDYEVMLLEWHDRRSPAVDAIIERYAARGLPAPVDTWIAMDRLAEQYYHKHVMYNAGILQARGPVVVIMDSDAILKTTFVQTVIDEFAAGGRLALHFEQIRNFDRSMYPFDYPMIDELTGPGCANAVDGVPNGFQTCAKSLAKDWNLWHVYNYGACFSARRDDLIAIGGADEHDDYLGHVCGPYEMTARLINAGAADRLHETHFLYHAYHPSQGGDGNYMGPNNGRGMSTTAMAIPRTRRILPLKENDAIRAMRLAGSGQGRSQR
ncbi:MAG: hypothetical protein LLG01_16080 [Planctomycetaceae bacterium]|nr:hypothetical protein [Planctomycetaceae bacterium]